VADVRLLRANLRKLRTRPASWVTLVLLVGLHALVMFFVILGSRLSTDPAGALAARQLLTYPAAYQITLSLVISIGGLLAVTYAAAIAGSEWTWGTLKSAVARGEGRATYLLLLFAAVTVATWVGLVAAFVVGVIVTAAGALLTGVGLAGMGDVDALLALPERFARAGLAMAMNASLGFAIATLTRSQLAGIGVGIGLFFAEGIAGIFAPQVIKWLPFTASGAAVEGGAGGSVIVNGAEIGASLDSTTAIVVTLLWLLGALLVAVVGAERAEIGG
jgi:ABC-2 type transport system permease protein